MLALLATESNEVLRFSVHSVQGQPVHPSGPKRSAPHASHELRRVPEERDDYLRCAVAPANHQNLELDSGPDARPVKSIALDRAEPTDERPKDNGSDVQADLQLPKNQEIIAE